MWKNNSSLINETNPYKKDHINKNTNISEFIDETKI